MPRVRFSEIERFCSECLSAAGASKPHAASMARALLAADQSGFFGHGLNRLGLYARDLKSGMVDGCAEPTVLKEFPASAWVDGKNALGSVVADFCMDIAINKAKQCGVGCVAAKSSNHFGVLFPYTSRALEQNLLALCFTNSSAVLSPTRSKKQALGTNPFSAAAPGENGDSFHLDVSTTAVALGRIETHNQNKQPIPDGWAKGPDGKSTTDPAVALKTGALMPLGGEEITSGFKGYGLALMVETLCGILAGGAFGPQIRLWKAGDKEPGDRSQCFIAVNPCCFAPGFECRMSELLNILRKLPPADPDKPVIVPGDLERQKFEQSKKLGAVDYTAHIIESATKVAEDYNVKPLTISD